MEKEISVWNRLGSRYMIPSMKVPLFILFMLIGVVPMLIQGKVMNRSFKQTQIDGRVIEVQNQCLITSERRDQGCFAG